MRIQSNGIAAALVGAVLTLPCWWRLGLQTLTIGLLALASTAPAWSEETVYVQEDGTAILTAPTDDAKVEWTLNRGHELIVLDRQGDWLKVRSRQFMSVGTDLWVPAARVGPPREDSASATPPAALEVEPTGPSFRLEIDGTPTLEFRAICRVVGAKGEAFQRYTASVPQVIDFFGAAVSCTARKLDIDGRLSLSLISRNGRRIASVTTSRPFNSVLVRSDGPWGEAGARRGRTRIVPP